MKKYSTSPFILAILVWILLSACSSTPTVEPNSDPHLQSIFFAYSKAVINTRTDPDLRWHHGRIGNSVVNLQGPPNVGLCYHWQEIVHKGTKQAILDTGWKSAGIAINEGNFLEHHAVLVYDPKLLKLNDILKPVNKSMSYVLDPWGSGEPRIYTVGQWQRLTVSIEEPARLTEILPGILSVMP